MTRFPVNGNALSSDTEHEKVGVGDLPASVVTDTSVTPKDIDSTGVADTNVLAYDAGSGKFKPVAGGGGYSGPGSDAVVLVGQGAFSFTASISAGSNQLSNCAGIAHGDVVLVHGAGAPASAGTTSAGLSTGGAITSIPVNALAKAWPGGDLIVVSGTHSQVFDSQPANAAATSITVASQTPNFAYPSGSTVGASTDLIGWVDTVISGVASLVTASGGSTALNASVTPANAFAAYGPDQTAAAISAQNTVEAAGGGTVYVAGIACIAGAFQTAPANGGGQTYCAQIPVGVSVPGIGTQNGAVIRWLGERSMCWPNEGVLGIRGGSWLVGMTPGQAYSVHNAIPCLLGSADISANLPNNGPRLLVENLAFLAPTNPGSSMINGACCTSLEVKGVGCYTPDNFTAYATAPTNPVAMAIIMPVEGNWGSNVVRDICVEGFYVGLEAGELTSGDNVNLDCNWIAISVISGIKHGVHLGFVMTNHSLYTIAYNDYTSTGVASFPAYPSVFNLTIDHIDWETGIGWQLHNPQFLINDPTNQLTGDIKVRLANTMTVNGGKFIRVRDTVQLGLVGQSTKVILTANQASSSSWPPTAISWSNPTDGWPDDKDELGAWSAGSPTRLTVPTNPQANGGGLYLIEACVEFDAVNSTVIGIWLNYNGSNNRVDGMQVTGATNANPTTLKLCTVMRLNQGDYLEVDQYSASATNITHAGNARTHFSLTRLA